jgi:hypothetical protein
VPLTHYQRQKNWLKKNPDYIRTWKAENPDYHKDYLKAWVKTYDGHISQLYSYIKKRVRTNKYYKGLFVCTRNEFTEWCKNNDDYKRLYILWVRDNYNRRITPSVNRKDSKKGYTLDNIEIITCYENVVDGCKQMMKARWKK